MIKTVSVSTPLRPWDMRDQETEAFFDGVPEHIGGISARSHICYYREEAFAFQWDGVMPNNKKIRHFLPYVATLRKLIGPQRLTRQLRGLWAKAPTRLWRDPCRSAGRPGLASEVIIDGLRAKFASQIVRLIKARITLENTE